jgi:hypothetical protein
VPERNLWVWVLLAIFATWRLSHLIAYEDGPWDAIARLRRRAGAGFWGTLMDCFYCVTLWAAVPFAALLRPSLREWPILWLGLAGGACLLERAGRSSAVQAFAGPRIAHSKMDTTASSPSPKEESLAS